jgi:tetratricopeptide (TPR) repeat protein
MTSIQAPKDAKKDYEKGLDLLKKQKWQEAQQHFQKAVDVYPKYAASWYELGMIYGQQKNTAESRKAYEQAIAADPKYLRPYLPMAMCAIQEKNWQDAADITGRLIRLDPLEYPEGFMYNAIANLNLRHLDAAEESARQAVKLDTGHQYPRAEYILGIVLANKQDYAGALQLLKSYAAHIPSDGDIQQVQKQIAQLEQAAASKQ